MNDPTSLREEAKRCRTLSKIATEPDVIEQLRVWAVELAEEADQTEWRTAEREKTIVSRSFDRTRLWFARPDCRLSARNARQGSVVLCEPPETETHAQVPAISVPFLYNGRHLNAQSWPKVFPLTAVSLTLKASWPLLLISCQTGLEIR